MFDVQGKTRAGARLRGQTLAATGTGSEARQTRKAVLWLLPAPGEVLLEDEEVGQVHVAVAVTVGARADAWGTMVSQRAMEGVQGRRMPCGSGAD